MAKRTRGCRGRSRPSRPSTEEGAYLSGQKCQGFRHVSVHLRVMPSSASGPTERPLGICGEFAGHANPAGCELTQGPTKMAGECGVSPADSRYPVPLLSCGIPRKSTRTDLSGVLVNRDFSPGITWRVSTDIVGHESLASRPGSQEFRPPLDSGLTGALPFVNKVASGDRR